MSEWRSVWSVRIEYARHATNSGYPYREVRVTTAAQLRRIIEWARANPGVLGFPYHRVSERHGPEPTRCRNGHDYDGPSTVRAGIDWTECPCGGHLVYLCRGGCDDVQIDPPVYYDCIAGEHELIAKARNRRKQP